MAKGTVAKENVVKIIQTAFGSDFIGESEKKYYVWADDGGQKVQIAISLTCPKNQVSIGAFEAGDFESMSDIPIAMNTSTEKAEITKDEMDNIASIMDKLGL